MRAVNISKMRGVLIRIPNRNRNSSTHTQCVTFVTVTKCHNFEFVTSVTLSVFFFCSKTDLVTLWSQMSQMVTNSNVTGTHLFLFLFRLKWFGMNEIRQNTPEYEVCFLSLFRIWIGRALRVSRKKLRWNRRRERNWDGTGAPNLSCHLSKTPAPQGSLDVFQRRSRLSRLAELLIPITISMPSLVYVMYVNCRVWRNEVYLIKNPLVPGQKTEQNLLGAH